MPIAFGGKMVATAIVGITVAPPIREHRLGIVH